VTDAIDRPEKESYVLVEFFHGEDAATPERYTDLERDFGPFVSTPTMEVEIPDNVGTFQEKEAQIILPLDDFTERLSDGLPHSPAFVKIEQQIRGLTAGEAGINLVLFRGRVERAIRNHQRRPGQVAIRALMAKSRLDVTLGLQMNHHDEARIFGPMSGLTQSAHDQTGEIAVIDGKEITIDTPNAAITSPTAPGGTNDRFWERGWLEKDSARIGIHIWTVTDPTVFVLRERPPADWLLAGAASILFVPGSHGTIEDARDVWDDEEHFLGWGYSTPSYNTIIQVSRRGTRS
jgi:hypothetical protein